MTPLGFRIIDLLQDKCVRREFLFMYIIRHQLGLQVAFSEKKNTD
jgi:hypothetical protein